jgi:hypothetical protein
MTYPGGEMLTYGYDDGGNLTSIVNGDSYAYIAEIGYDEYEQKVFCAYGNGTTHTWDYTPELRRLEQMKAISGSDNEMYNNTYTYDNIGNILSLINTATANPIGGGYGHTYSYDQFNRLATANSYWEHEPGNQTAYANQLVMNYDVMHRIDSKYQQQVSDGLTVNEHSYFKKYEYSTNNNHIKKVVNNGTNSGIYKYDQNGNMRNISENGLPISPRFFAWDEANRLKAVKVANNLIQHHLYDANGERTHKGSCFLQQVGINGGPAGYDYYIGNYTIYPSGYETVGEYGLVTKHYYSGSQRIATRLSGNVSAFNAADQEDLGMQGASLFGRQLNDINHTFDYFQLDHPGIWNVPGLASPCNQGEDVDEQCVCVFQHNCNDGILYFFHSDHLGTSTFLTDATGEPYQFFLNLPFGETMEEQFALSPKWWSTPYLFNGKELDSRTSLYYYVSELVRDIEMSRERVKRSSYPAAKRGVHAEWYYDLRVIFLGPKDALTRYYL